MADTQAISTESFVQSLGVNTHIDFGGSYANLATVEAAINYLGITNLRDSPGNSGDLSTWQQVAQATGAKFDAYIGETSPGGMTSELGTIQQLAQEGILNYIEGGNEEDDSYPASLGNNLSITALFQRTLYGVAQSLGLPAINMSFGAGWTAANDWHGDYDKVGDLSGITDYANAHTYPSGAPDTTIQQLNSDALIAAGSRPVMTTEFGYDTNVTDATQAAKWTLDATLDAMKDGDAKTYFYALFNDESGAFGLMNADGSPKPAGAALHNLTSLLQDAGGSFSPGSLNYTIDNTASGDNSLLMEKSDGSYWLALWNESNGGHTVTLNLANTASQVEVYDPLTGTSAVQTAGDTNSVQINVPDHPVLVEIIPSGSSAPAPSTAGDSSSPSSSTTTADNSTGSDSTTPAATGTNTDTNTAPATSSTASDSSSNGVSVSAPTDLQTNEGQATPISGVSLSDDYASSNGSQVSVTISDTSGTLSTVDAWGNSQSGDSLTLSGTIWQVNAGLANLAYTGNGNNDTVTISATDENGGGATQSVAVGDPNSSGGAAVTSSGSGDGNQTSDPTQTTTPTSSSDATSIAANDANPVISVSGTAINASAGDHMIFIAASGDTVTATGGTETVQAYQGGNSITTGDGDDTIRFAGSDNTIDAGAGNNQLEDSGSNNTIILPSAGQGYDNILGWVTQNGDTFDLRPALAQAGWNGDSSTIGNYVQVGSSGANAIVSIGGSAVATLNDAGGTDLSSFLSHAIT